MTLVLPWILALALGGLHAWRRFGALDRAGLVELLFRWQLGLGLGTAGLVGFAGHALAPARVAAGIGWPVHPQFQLELAGFELGFGLAALAGLRLRHRWYWLGVVLAPCLFLLVAAGQHLAEVVRRGNLAAYNVLAIVPDLLLPATLLGLLGWLFALERARERMRPAADRARPCGDRRCP